jgi:hypothetical protein
MIPAIPRSIELILLATDALIAVAVWSIVSSGASRSDLAPADQRRVRIGTGFFLAIWLGAALLLAPSPESLLTRDPRFLTPQVPLFLVVPLALALLAVALSSALRRALAAASLPALIGVQLYRTIGLVFLILLAQGQLPARFALPAGWGDVAVGLSAPLVALAIARGAGGSRTLATAWNGLGLLDLFVAVGMGSGLLVPKLGSASAMGVFPLIMVPAFAVPVSVLLHLIALRRLRQDSTQGAAHSRRRMASALSSAQSRSSSIR